jgi:hypothetical protein
LQSCFENFYELDLQFELSSIKITKGLRSGHLDHCDARGEVSSGGRGSAVLRAVPFTRVVIQIVVK